MNEAKKVKILVTGGHITPAIAVIEEVRRRFPHWEIVLVGRSLALEREKISSEEERLADLYKVRFISMHTGRMTRALSLQTVLSLLKLPGGFREAWNIVRSEKPALIVSFGGYIALPVVVAGWFLGITVVTHEQTRVSGLANRLISLIAKKIAVSFPDKSGQIKTVYTGLPIRSGMFHSPKNSPRGVTTALPLLFITGGSTGARSMNELIFPLIPWLTQAYMVVHQTGSVSFSRAKEVRERLPKEQREHYAVFGYIDMPDYAWVLHHAHVILGRSGANTVGEAAMLGKVALWIPLPWSSGHEQTENARFLANVGSSLVVNQQSLTPEALRSSIEQIEVDYKTREKRAETYATSVPHDGAARVVDIMSELVDA